MKCDANEGTPFKKRSSTPQCRLERCLTSSEEAKDIDWGDLLSTLERVSFACESLGHYQELAAIFEGIVEIQTTQRRFAKCLKGF